jgi:hypothetical protein
MFGPANIEPLYSVVDTRFSNGPLDDLSGVAKDIRRAATMLGWIVEDREPTEILATNRKGQHAGIVTIRFDTAKFSINYRNSTRLDYDGDNIHKLYNRWVADLERAIQQETSP